MVSRYAVLDDSGRCVNVVEWDGDKQTWDAGTYTAVPYDPTVHALAVPVEQVNEAAVASRADAALADLRSIANSTGTMSTAQLSNAVRILAKVALALARIALRRFDGTD